MDDRLSCGFRGLCWHSWEGLHQHYQKGHVGVALSGQAWDMLVVVRYQCIISAVSKYDWAVNELKFEPAPVTLSFYCSCLYLNAFVSFEVMILSYPKI